MGSKSRRRRGSDSSDPSSSDDTSTDPTTPPRSTRKKEDKLIKRVLEELKDTRNELRKQLKELTDETKQLKELTDETGKQLKELTDETGKQFKELTESQNKLCKQLELHINGLSGDDSAASRSESNQVQPPRYRLEFTCEVNDEIEKEKIIETKSHGKMISVALKDDQNQIVKTGPLASAKVKLVVINGEFNQQDNQCNWSRKEFEKAICRPRNSAMGDGNQSAESIVKNCFFNLIDGVKSHGDATILYNSSNKKVRLAVMMVSPTEERVLEGLSNPFFVRGHDRKRTKKQKALAGFDFDERNAGLMPPREIIPQQLPGNSTMLPTEPLLPGNTTVLPTGPSTSAWIQQDQNSHPTMSGTSMVQAATPTHSLHAGVEHSMRNDLMDPNSALFNYSIGNGHIPTGSVPRQLSGNMLSTGPSTSVEQGWIQQYQNSDPTMYRTSTAQVPYSLQAGGENSAPLSEPMDTNSATHNHSTGMQCNWDTRAFPVHLVWDRLIAEPRKSWNLFDQLMPLYSCQPKFNNGSLPTMHLMTERLGSLTLIPKDVMQTRRKSGVLIEPLESDDSNEKELLERRLHSKYTLRFVNKVCKTYYKWEKIKADDGNPLKVALFDENDRKITSGPLSSASVEVVALHGDFNADGQDFWTPEDFSRCIVCPRPGKSEAVLGGDRILTLADGEACLGDTYFRVTSFRARTGRFMMGVRVASVQGGRIQEGTSEPFLVMERAWQAGGGGGGGAMAAAKSDLESKAKEAFVDDYFELAAELYTQAIDAGPATADLYADRAQAHIKLGNYTEAVADANKAIELDPMMHKAYLRKGAACIKLEEYQTAKAALELGSSYASGDSRFTRLLRECDERIAEEASQVPVKKAESAPVAPSVGAPVEAKNDGANLENAQPTIEPPSKPKYRHDFYNSPTEVVLIIFAKGVPADSVVVDFGEQMLSVSIEVPGEEPYHFQPRLFSKIIPEKCKYQVLSTKVEIRLAKAEQVLWTSLDYNGKPKALPQKISTPASSAPKPSYPSSKSKKDWDKLEAEVKKEEKEEKLDGDAALNKFFRDIYKDADEDMRRAMMKSFVESNGTVLSTNWKDVGSKRVEGSPPDGMELKKWEY